MKKYDTLLDPAAGGGLETFVPLYLTNTCHGSCRVCNMRTENKRLKRIDLNQTKAREQLSVILNVEGIRAVCLLTGEYTQSSPERRRTFQFVRECVGLAFSMGFGKVYLGVGAMTDEEIAYFATSFQGNQNLVLSLFQETYDREVYGRFFGGGIGNPKSDFDFRRSTPTRWLEAGFVSVDLGVLIGLRDPDSDVSALISHANELLSMGGEVALSLPRIIGIKNLPVMMDDTDYAVLVQRVSKEIPDAKVVITTRETFEMIKNLLPWVGIVSPGSSDVHPYNLRGEIPNHAETSQFQVRPTRPRPSWVLSSLDLPLNAIQYFSNPHQKIGAML